MFFTWVERSRNSSPSDCRGSLQSGEFPRSTQVRFMFPAASRSTSAEPSRLPKYQSPSTSSCAARTGASSSRRPVTMFTTPAGRSEVSNTW